MTLNETRESWGGEGWEEKERSRVGIESISKMPERAFSTVKTDLSVIKKK